MHSGISGQIDSSFNLSTSSHSGYSNGLEQNQQRTFHQTISSESNGIDNSHSVGDIICNIDDIHYCHLITNNTHNFMCSHIDSLVNNADNVRNNQQIRDISQTYENKEKIKNIKNEIDRNVKSMHKLPKIMHINIDKFESDKSEAILITKENGENGARLSATMSVSTGHLANMWQLKEKLGDGAFGSVWHAISRIDSQSYAIKLIPFYHKSESEENESEENEESLREVRTMAKMDSHPSVVRYYTAWIEEMHPFIHQKIKDIDNDNQYDDIPRICGNVITPLNESERISIDYDEYDIKDESISFNLNTIEKKIANRVLIIQMEMCDNGTLKDWLQSRKEVDYIQSLQIFRQLVEALYHIHQNHVLHRDVKPGNAFLCKKGGIKLGDFGFAASINNKLIEDDDELTLGLGTPTYAAPEQINESQMNESQILHKTYSKPADIYPLGLIAYELLNKWSTGMERVIAMNQLKTKSIINDTKFKERWPRMSYLIEAMVSSQPEDRPTCQDILEVLDIEWNELQIDCCSDAQTMCKLHSISISPQSVKSKFRRTSGHLLLSPTSETSELNINNETSPDKFKQMEQKLVSKDEEIEMLKKRIIKLENIINIHCVDEIVSVCDNK